MPQHLETPDEINIATDSVAQADIVSDTQNDFDNFDLATPSSHLNDRPGKRSPTFRARRLGKWKFKGKPRLSVPQTGDCWILGLPDDVLRLLLSRIPPRDLKVLGETCGLLRFVLEDESIWRESYINRFLWDGADKSDGAKDEVRVLVQPSLGEKRGWKKEALGREAMLERWTGSKASPVSHHPPIGLIHALSLSYPIPTSGRQRELVVGKAHSRINSNILSPQCLPTPDPSGALESSGSTAPTKMTHRQKYEALMAATTRPAPYVLSASLGMAAIVRSDPLSGKVSKGFWGPGRDANFHLRPHFDHSVTPTAMFLPTREQTFVLWGLLHGVVVHTSILSKHPSTPGSRASSINVQCLASDAHEGAINDIWAPKMNGTPRRWVTAGYDGRVKYWQYNPPPGRKSGKRSSAEESQGSVKCLFTSDCVLSSLMDRSEEVKRRQTGAPDPIAYARCVPQYGVICGVTDDGDLRVWFGCNGVDASVQEARIDAGGEEQLGAVKRMELEVTLVNGTASASILIHHHRSPIFARYDVTLGSNGEPKITTNTFSTPQEVSLTIVEPFLEPTPPISSRPRHLRAALASPALSNDLADDDDFELPSTQASSPTPIRPFGRCVMAGDAEGGIWIWPWDTPSSFDGNIFPVRAWSAMSTKITAIDYHCGLVAVGSCDAYINIYDPLTKPPTLLRSFRASHLSPADAQLAASDELNASSQSVNQIILENDLVIASVGRKVFAWRAGSGKRQNGKGEKKKGGGGKTESKGMMRTLDLRSLHEDAASTKEEMREMRENAAPIRLETNSERQQREVMDDLGLEDGDDALQYALMLSMDQQSGVPDAHIEGEELDMSQAAGDGGREGEGEAGVEASEEEDQAVRAVEEFKKKEDKEMRQVLEMVRRAELREAWEPTSRQ